MLNSIKQWDLGISTGGQKLLWLPTNKARAAPARNRVPAPP